MRICIYGAGAMGTSFGNALLRAGVECEFVTRNPSHVPELKKQGKNACFPSEMQGVFDVIVLATKQRENDAIARFLLPFLKEDGALVTVQNGLPEAGLAEVFGADRVYGCALGWGAEFCNGRLVVTSSEKKYSLAIGAYGEGKRLRELASLLRRAFRVKVGPLNEIRFSKLVVNSAFSTLSALSGLTFGELAERYTRLALSLMRETVSVAKACGCRSLSQNGHNIMRFANSPIAGKLLPHAMKKHAHIRSGMLRDLKAGNRCDIDLVAGAVVKAGEEKGVETPLLRRAVLLVHAIEEGRAGISPQTLNELV